MAQKAAKYNIKIDILEKMYEDQDNRCAICGRASVHGRSLDVDHDHSCCPGVSSCGECVRGLLCTSCNRAIGLFGDDVPTLFAAIEYLRKF